MVLDLNGNLDKLQALEKVANDYLINRTSKENLLKQTEDCLGRISNGKLIFKADIVKSNSKTPFIMCVFPSPADLESASRVLVEDLHHNDNSDGHNFIQSWQDLSHWNIEIDSRVFDKYSAIRFDNGGQYIALLCHELGHVMNTHPTLLVANYRKNLMQYKLLDRVMLKNPVVTLLFLPMFVCASGVKFIVQKPTNDINEIAADSRVPQYYKPYLLDYIDNHIIRRPDTGIVVTQQEYDNEQDMGIRFTRNCIDLMRRRRNVLKMNLNTQERMANTPFFKEICQLTSKAVGKVTFDTGVDESVELSPRELEEYRKQNMANERYDKYVAERFNSEYDRVEKECNAILEAKNVTERDIVMVQVDIDGMRTIEDKSYVMNTISDYIEALEKKKSKQAAKYRDIGMIPEDATTDLKLKQLRELQTKAMAVPVSNGDKYGVFVRYPTGYEG